MKKLFIIFLLLIINTAFCYEYTQQDAQRFSAYYSNGMDYLKKGQYSSAIVEFKKVLRVSPYDTTVQNALVNSYFARGQYFKQTTKEYSKALNDYKSAYFYSRYWSNTPSSSTLSLSNSAKNEINDIEKKLQIVSTNPDNRFQSAKILRAQGELAASGYDFQEIKNTKYKNTALENLANIYKNLNNLSMGMDYMKQAIDDNPKNAKLHFLYGVMLDEANNYEASVEQYNLALKYGDNSPELLEILENKWTQNIVNNPNDAQGYINLGAIYQKRGNYEAALRQYLKATQLNPDDAVGFYNLASLYVQQKNYPEALNIYNELLKKNPNNVEVLEYKADILKKLNRFDEALNQYDLILAIQPDNKEIKDIKDDIILNNYSGEKLEKYLQTKALNSPNSYEAQFNYALELHKNKKYSEAIVYYNKALNINPSKEENYINLAQIYIEQKNFSKAAEICEKGLLILPNNDKLQAYLSDAKNYKTASQFDKAGKLFDEKQYSLAINEYLKIENQTPDVNLAIASCYLELNDYNNAVKYYNKVLNSETNNPDALYGMAFSYYSMNDFNNAKLYANKLLAMDKTNLQAQEILSLVDENEFSGLLNSAVEKYEQGDYQTCLSLINKVLSQKPTSDFGLYYKGLSLDELNKNNDAVKVYRELISIHPNFSSAYYSLAVDLDNLQKYDEAVKNYEKFITLKGAEKDAMTEFSANRIKELKDYLNSVNKK